MNRKTDDERVALELAHTPGPEKHWQESLVLLWWDEAQGVGGFHRVGHEPNKGKANLWCGLFTTAGHAYRRNIEDMPLKESDRERPNFGAGVQTFSFDDRLRLNVTDTGVAVNLELEDFYPPGDVYDRDELTPVEDNVIRDHIESSGRLRGTVRLGDSEFRIDALAHRDHSWGPRDWGNINSHRWIVGTCGPDLSFSIGVLVGNQGDAMYVAFVHENGRMRTTTDFDVVSYLEWDSVSCRGGWVDMRFDDGSRLRLDCEDLGGWVFTKDAYIAHDSICRVTTSDGRTGFCDFELSNGRRTTELPLSARAINEDGRVTPA